MQESIKVSLDDLPIILDLIIKELKLLGVHDVELTGDYYWLVAGDDRKDFSTNQPKLCIGSIIDDWTELKKAMDRKFATSVDMERLANIMIEIIEETSRHKGDDGNKNQQ